MIAAFKGGGGKVVVVYPVKIVVVGKCPVGDEILVESVAILLRRREGVAVRLSLRADSFFLLDRDARWIARYFCFCSRAAQVLSWDPRTCLVLGGKGWMVMGLGAKIAAAC